MSTITMYTSPICPYCVKAKQLLAQKGITTIVEIDISRDDTARDTMMQQSGGRRTVPQIFINGTHIGGCDDLYALDKAGGLDPLLAA
jgi:glutaredoxin 3